MYVLLSDSPSSEEPRSKRPRHIEPLNSEVSTTSPDVSITKDDIFVESELFSEFVTSVNNLKDAVMIVQGPKGFGKTTFLQKFHDLNPTDSTYIDLAWHSPDDIFTLNGRYVLMDNAQIYGPDWKFSLRNKTTIAAFSSMRSRGMRNIAYKTLSRRGFTRPFFMRPFTYHESKKLVKMLGFRIVKNGEKKIDIENNRICINHLKEVYCICNGNPSHMRDYLLNESYCKLLYDASEEYEDSQNTDIQGGLGLRSADKINDSIIQLIVNGTCHLHDIPVKLGLAYCMKSDGTGNFKCSSPIYLRNALSRRGGFEFQYGQYWQRLEALTTMLIVASTNKLHGDKDVTLPMAHTCHHQREIGELSKCHIKEHEVTYLVLAPNHNIIDRIFYDRRRKNLNAYILM